MPRALTRRQLVGAGMMGAGAMLIPSCVNFARAQGEPVRGGSIRVGRPGDFLHFDPFFAITANLPMYRQLYNTLVVYDAELNPQPQLAESWEFSDDRLTVTFKLRSGVTFHNGQEFTADDVVANIERAQDATLSHSLLGYTRPMTGVTAPDPLTVEFTFSEPANAIFDLLTVMGIVAPEAFANPLINPVGTGPFSFAEWNPGQEARFVRYENYWEEGLPYADEIIVRGVPDQQAAVASLEAGELDIIQGVPLNEVPRLRESSDLAVVLGTEASQFYTFYCNTARPPFDQKEVRQAMSHAIDRQTIVDTVLFGVGKATQSPFPEWSLAYNAEHVDWFPYDLDRAKELLTQAGHGDGFETSVVTISDASELRNMAQIIQADLATIGVTLTINDVTTADWGQLWPAKEYDTLIASAGFSHKDPSTLFNSMSGFRLDDNRTNFSPPTYRELVTAAAGITEPEERKQAYDALGEYMLDEAFALVLSFRYNVFGVRNSVQNFRVHLDDDMDLSEAWLA
ncbi:MAG: ABC transporter substrate-binding protein [Thermomicrobiales bacterium]